MKRLFSVLVLGVLMLSIPVVTCAEGNFRAYGDFIIGGQYNYSYSGNSYYDSDSYSKSFSLFILGGQYTSDNFKIVGEMSLSSQINSTADLSFTELKGGYCLLKTERSKFDTLPAVI